MRFFFMLFEINLYSLRQSNYYENNILPRGFFYYNLQCTK